MLYLRRTVWIITACFWVTMFIATHIPVERVPGVRVSDKTLHFVGYAALGVLLYLSLWLKNPSRRGIGRMVIGIAMVYAAIDELLQIPVGRSAEWGDWFADVAGATSAVVVMSILRMYISPLVRRSRHGTQPVEIGA